MNQMTALLKEAEDIVYKLSEGIPQSSMWETEKKRMCCLFSVVATETNAATRIPSQLQADLLICQFTQLAHILLRLHPKCPLPFYKTSF